MKILRTLPFVLAALLTVFVSAAGASSRMLCVLGLMCLVMATAVSLFGYEEWPTKWGAWAVEERPQVQKRRLRVIGLSLMVIFSVAVSQWPLRLSFWMARPALERVAQQVQHGTFKAHQAAGLFIIVSAEAGKDRVMLRLDDNVLIRHAPGKKVRWSGEETTVLDSKWSLYCEM